MTKEDLKKLQDQAHRAIDNQSMVAVSPKMLLDLCEIAEAACEPEKS